MYSRNIRLIFRAASVCIAFSLTACTVLGPDYQEPEAKWLNEWQPSAYPVTESPLTRQADELEFWWQLFNDPVLNRLITIARQENRSLRIAGLRILESRAVLGIAGSALYPQVQQASGGLNYVKTEQHGGGPLAEASQGKTSYQLGVAISWELDFWGRFKRSIESADAAYFASIANQRDAQVLISASVADLYFLYRTTLGRIKIANENAARQKRSYEITELTFKLGGESELDLQQARTQYLTTLSGIPQLESALIKTRNALAALLGREPGDLPELSEVDGRLPDIQQTAIQSIPVLLLGRRPDVRAAAWQVAAQSAQIGIAEADYYPSISLLGSLGLAGDDRSGSADIGSFSIGPSLRWNIFDHGRIENNVRVQDARLQQLIENYQETVLQAAREVDDAAITVHKSAESQVLLDESVAAAERTLDIAIKRYREGYADFQRVLDAQRTLFNQAERQQVNHGGYISAIISLYKGLGGGWSKTPVDQLIPEDTRKTMQDRVDWGNLLTAPIEEPTVIHTGNKEASQNE